MEKIMIALTSITTTILVLQCGVDKSYKSGSNLNAIVTDMSQTDDSVQLLLIHDSRSFARDMNLPELYEVMITQDPSSTEKRLAYRLECEHESGMIELRRSFGFSAAPSFSAAKILSDAAAKAWQLDSNPVIKCNQKIEDQPIDMESYGIMMRSPADAQGESQYFIEFLEQAYNSKKPPTERQLYILGSTSQATAMGFALESSESVIEFTEPMLRAFYNPNKKPWRRFNCSSILCRPQKPSTPNITQGSAHQVIPVDQSSTAIVLHSISTSGAAVHWKFANTIPKDCDWEIRDLATNTILEPKDESSVTAPTKKVAVTLINSKGYLNCSTDLHANFGGSLSNPVALSVKIASSFFDWCDYRQKATTFLSPDQIYTVDILMDKANTSNCFNARQFFEHQTSLDLRGNLNARIDSLINLENQIAIRDLSPLASFSNLQQLNLALNDITNIDILRKLVNLRRLDLTSNNLTSEAVTKAFGNAVWKDLTWVSLAGNRLNKVPNLGEAKVLTYLNLGYNLYLSDVTVIENYPSLQQLNLSTNSLSAIAPLRKLAALQNLRLDNNYLTDVGPLLSLTNLQSLSLQYNRRENANLNITDDFALLKNLDDLFIFETGSSCPGAMNIGVCHENGLTFDQVLEKLAP